MSGTVCDERMPIILETAVFNTTIRYAIMYGSETCSLRKDELILLERTRMSMLRRVMGIQRIEKIRKYMKEKQVKIEEAQDKITCKLKTICTEYKYEKARIRRKRRSNHYINQT